MNKMLTKNKRTNMFVRMMETIHLPEDFVDWLMDEGFFTAPASTKYHGAYEGGLFDHSFAVTESLVNFTDKIGLTWEHPRSPWIVGMFHDLCKIDSYKKVILMGEEETTDEVAYYEYSDAPLLYGHGEKSVMLLSRWLQLTEEEVLCIRYHMGEYKTDNNEWDYLDKAIKKYPNVLWIHTADMYASKVVGV